MKTPRLREKHEMADGFQISKNITLAVSVEQAYNAWAVMWSGELAGRRGFYHSKSDPNKSLRVTWADGKTSLEVYFYPKNDRVQISVNHSKILTRNRQRNSKHTGLTNLSS